MATRATKAPARKPGRPSKYTDQTAKQAEKLCLLGATDVDLASFFEVHSDTIAEWKVRHPEFSEALKRGKETPDAMVERKLFERATGYSHPEDDIRTLSVGNGVSEIVITPTIKHYPPDTVACIFWLKNRRPDRWRQQPEEFGDDAPPPVRVVIEVKDASTPEPV